MGMAHWPPGTNETMVETPATMLVVSHDRRFLETVVERLWVVDDGQVAPFDGGYRAWRSAIADGSDSAPMAGPCNGFTHDRRGRTRLRARS